MKHQRRQITEVSMKCRRFLVKLVPRAGARRLVAIEGFVYQLVDRIHRGIQIMSGKCDQKIDAF
ncbi:MAG: hypothetical protein IKX67_02425 [Bacteroidales bacterium]|nr:hypothetical protein [Bacteroidales bacterium]